MLGSVILGACFAIFGLAMANGQDGTNAEPVVEEGPYVNGISAAELDNPAAPLPPAHAEEFEEPNHIAEGFQPSQRMTDECSRLLSGEPAETDAPRDEWDCKLVQAIAAGEIPPGDYSDAELEAEVRAYDAR